MIIKKVLAGETNAFAILVDRYKDLSITLANNVLLHREDAEDVVQDAFIKAFSALATFKGEAKFSTWFYRIVMNIALSKRSLKKLPTINVDETTDLGEMGNVSINLDNYSFQQQRRFIQQGLKQLHQGERICITMYYLNELSIGEIQELTGYSHANIKVLLFRGRKQLYNALSGILQHELKDLI